MSTSLFVEFVDRQYGGVRSRAAEALEIDQSMVSRLCSGERRVSPALALRIEQLSGGAYAKEAFIWPEESQEGA